MKTRIKAEPEPYLGNVKFIFHEYDVEGIQNKFDFIDTVLRDIAKQQIEEENEEVTQVEKKESPTQEKEVTEIQVQPKIKTPKQNFIISIPYKVSPATVSQTIRTATSTYVQDNLQSNNLCSHCHSKEVIQQDQLAQLSHWRKTVMENVVKRSALSKHSVLNRRRMQQALNLGKQ